MRCSRALRKLPISVVTFSITLFSSQALANIDSGLAINKEYKASTNHLIGSFKQSKTASGFVTTNNGKVSGNSQKAFKVRVGPNSKVISAVSGDIHFSFEPEKLNCTQGLNLSYSIGPSTPISISPSCDRLLKQRVSRSWNHVIASEEVTLPKVPLDSMGLFKVVARVGGTIAVGADFYAQLEVGGFGRENSPIYRANERLPDVLKAGVSPRLGGSVTGKASVALELFGFKRIEKGVSGRLNLVNVGGHAEMEGGVTYQSGASGGASKPYQYYTRYKLDGYANGGGGDLSVYCDVTLFGFWNIFNRSKRIAHWDPVFETRQTFFEQSHYL